MIAEVVLQSLSISDIIAILGLLGTLITGIIALVKHLKAKNYLAALTDAEFIGANLMGAIDGLKKVTPEPERTGVMKRLGAQLGALKGSVDGKLRDLGFDEKS